MTPINNNQMSENYHGLFQKEVIKATIKSANEQGLLKEIESIVNDYIAVYEDDENRIAVEGLIDKKQMIKMLATLISHERAEAVRKCIEIAKSDDYIMFIRNDESTEYLEKSMAIRKQARNEVAQKLKEYLNTKEVRE